MPTSLRLALISALAALVLGVAGASASTGPTIALHGGHGRSSAVICGARHHYRLYHRRELVRFTGTIPAAVATRVKIKVKQCVHGSFITRVVTHAQARNGRFDGSLLLRRRGFYTVRAYYSGQKSEKRYLRVT